MNAKVTRWLILPLALACAAVTAQPAPRNIYFSPDDKDERPADEQNPRLPPFPREEGLVKVELDGRGGFEFFVDLESVNVGGDGVVRYTLVARSEGGATNIVYEGIRCKGRERRLYALGRADKTWSTARNQQWMPISDLPVNRIQSELHDSYFCPARIIAKDTEEARMALKRGGHPRRVNPSRE